MAGRSTRKRSPGATSRVSVREDSPFSALDTKNMYLLCHSPPWPHDREQQSVADKQVDCEMDADDKAA